MLVREGALDALDLPPQLLDRALVAGNVVAVLLLDHLDEVLHDALVEVLAAQMRVAVRREHLEDAVVDREERDVEGAATKVKDQDVLLALLLVHAVGDGRRGGLVDDALHRHAADRARVLRRLALRVVEVGRHRDDGVLHLAAQEGLGRGPHLREDHGADLLRREDLLLPTFKDDLHVGLVVLGHEREGEELLVRLHGLLVELAADQTLHIKDRVLGVDGGLVLRRVADQALAGVVPRDVRGRDAVALVVRDDLDAAVLEDADARVRRAQINTDDRAQVLLGDGRGRERRRGERGAHHLSLLLLLWVRVCLWGLRVIAARRRRAVCVVLWPAAAGSEPSARINACSDSVQAFLRRLGDARQRNARIKGARRRLGRAADY